MIAGRTDPSTTHRLSTPRTRHSVSTTASASPSTPIGAVHAKCCDVDHVTAPICAVAPTNSRAISAPASSRVMSAGARSYRCSMMGGAFGSGDASLTRPRDSGCINAIPMCGWSPGSSRRPLTIAPNPAV